jgi:hypothetical protein
LRGQPRSHGAKTQSTKDNLRRSNSTINFVWSPVWKEVIKRASYKAKIGRIQRMVNIKIANRTVSNKAMCVITELIPIQIKIQEAANLLYLIKIEGINYEITMESRHCIYPSKQITIVAEQ